MAVLSGLGKGNTLHDYSIPPLNTELLAIAQVNLHPKVVHETCEPAVERIMADLTKARVAFRSWAAWIAMVRRLGLTRSRQNLTHALRQRDLRTTKELL